MREQGGEPSSRQVDKLLDERFISIPRDNAEAIAPGLFHIGR